MNFDPSIIFLIALGILVLIIFIISLHSAKESIRHDLQLRGAKDIVIHYEWLDFDRSTMTFYVEFINSSGNKFKTRCKLHHWGLFVDNEVYW